MSIIIECTASYIMGLWFCFSIYQYGFIYRTQGPALPLLKPLSLYYYYPLSHTGIGAAK